MTNVIGKPFNILLFRQKTPNNRRVIRSPLDRRRTMSVGYPNRILISALLFLCMPTFVGAQALNEAFLRSTVLISFELAPNTKSSGTGCVRTPMRAGLSVGAGGPLGCQADPWEPPSPKTHSLLTKAGESIYLLGGFIGAL